MTPATKKRLSTALVIAVVLSALVIRLWDLGRRGLNHPENYVPGLPMPAWVNLPPPRTDVPSLAKSILKDAHPPLYYLAMFAWVKAFGITTFALRLPSALLGAASVFLLWRIALRELRREAALLAALLLALHGTHVYWSQTARMYAAASFLSLLSTLMLLRAFEDGRKRFQIAYALSATFALWTQIYCWPVLLGQIVWASLRSVRDRRAPAALPAQFAAVILSMPVIALTVYQWRPNVVLEPRLEYFELGHLFSTQAFSFFGPLVPPVSHGILLAIGLLCTVLGLFARPAPAMAEPSYPAVAVSLGFRRRLLAAGALVSAALAWAAQHAFLPGSRPFMLAMGIAALPIVIAALFKPVYAWMVSLAARDSGPIQAVAARVRRISPVLALLPVACMMLAGSFRDVFVVRGAMIYVPYLLVLFAAGLTPANRLRWVMLAPLLVVLWLHVRSVGWWLKAEHSPRDYKGFAETFRQRLEPDDLVLITNLYSDPPLLYYFPDKFPQFVPPSEYEAALRRKPSSRVWVVLFEDQEMNDGMRAAVSGRRAGEPATASGARGLLYLP